MSDLFHVTALAVIEEQAGSTLRRRLPNDLLGIDPALQCGQARATPRRLQVGDRGLVHEEDRVRRPSATARSVASPHEPG